MATTDMHFRRLSKDVELTVTIIETKEWQIRQSVSLSLFKLAAWVLGARAKVVTAGDDGTE